MNVFGYNVTETFVYAAIIAIVFLIGLIMFMGSGVQAGMSDEDFQEASMHRSISYVLLISAIIFGAGLAYVHKDQLGFVIKGEMGGCGCDANPGMCS